MYRLITGPAIEHPSVAISEPVFAYFDGVILRSTIPDEVAQCDFLFPSFRVFSFCPGSDPPIQIAVYSVTSLITLA